MSETIAALEPPESPAGAPRSPHERYRAARHFPALDGIRCAAILGVIWHHTMPESDVFPAAGRGYLGVDLFFVLSGFLIVTLLLRERDRTGGVSLRDFYARRTLRIFPVFYGLLLGLTVLMLVAKRSTEMSQAFFAALPFYATYTSNWILAHAPNLGITWSLSAEEQFYVVWPAVEKFLAKRWVWATLGLGLAVNQCVNFKLADPLLQSWFGIRHADLPMLQVTFTPIILGVALAHLLHRERTFRVIHAVVGRKYGALVAFAVLIAVCNLPGDQTGWPRLLTQVTMMAFLASCVVREDHALLRALTLPGIVRIGMISYGMYLFHLWARHIVVDEVGALGRAFPGAAFIFTLILAILISELSFRFYEQPFLSLKKRFSRR